MARRDPTFLSPPGADERRCFMGDGERHPSSTEDDRDDAGIYERMKARMLRLFGHQPWIEDVIHTAYAKFMQSRGSFRGEGSLEAFADRIALNTARDVMRRQKRTAIVHDLLRQAPRWPSLPPSPDVQTEERERMRRLHHLLERLDPIYRIPYLLYHVENRTLEEIAFLENVTTEAIKKRLTRARRKLHARARKDPVLREWLDGIEGRP